MRILKDKKPLVISIAIGIFEIALIYVVFYYNYNSNIFTSLNNITWDSILSRLVNDYFAMLLIPTTLIILNKKNMSIFRLNLISIKEIIFLSAIMILLFFLHNDFTIKGFYQFFFYLVFVAFAEEFIYRGFIYNILKGNSKALAIIISGIFWGITHAVLPSIIYDRDMVQFLLSMQNQIGFGIVVGWYFIYLLEKSKTLWIPILIHAILDYTVGPIGIMAGVGMFLYYLLKSKDRTIEIVE